MNDVRAKLEAISVNRGRKSTFLTDGSQKIARSLAFGILLRLPGRSCTTSSTSYTNRFIGYSSQERSLARNESLNPSCCASHDKARRTSRREKARSHLPPVGFLVGDASHTQKSPWYFQCNLHLHVYCAFLLRFCFNRISISWFSYLVCVESLNVTANVS